MATEYTLTARLTKGKLHVRAWSRLADAIKTWRDGEYTITMARKHATRRLQANAWYWSQVVGLVAEHTGYTPDEIHDIYKAKFLPKKLAMADQNGVIVGEFVVGGSSAKLNTVEFYEYCEAIRAWAREDLGVVIPDPDPAWRTQRAA